MSRSSAGRMLSATLAAVLALGHVLPESWAQPAAESRLEEAKTHVQLGEFEEAAGLLRLLMAEEVSAATRRDAALYLGWAEMELGRDAEAREAFGEVLRLEPDFRPDAAQFPPRLRTAFDEVRAAAQTGRVSDVVSLLEPQGRLSPPGQVPSAFRRRWYQRWWVYAAVGAVGIGATALLVGGGSGYDPPTVTLEVVTAQCGAPNPPGRYEPGNIEVEARVADGAAPFTLSFLDNGMPAGTASTTGAPARFTFLNVPSSEGGGCLNHSLEVRVTDAQNNGGRQVGANVPVQVCRCF
jgi:hypothetical protein